MGTEPAMTLRTLALLLVTALAVPRALPTQTAAADGQPTSGEVALPCAVDWNAFLVHDAGVGVWTVKAFPVFPWFGCPEIVAMDDKGRCTVLVSYSGKWTPIDTVFDGQWLAPVGHADVDPRSSGKELYVGGKSGNLYQLRIRGEREFDTEEIAHWSDEIHTIVAEDLRPDRPGDELLVFLKGGEVWELVAEGETGFARRKLATLPGRVRDALVLPARGTDAPVRLATVSRAAEVAILELRSSGMQRRPILAEPMGFGRVARRPSHRGEPEVLYVTRDDGLLLRLSEQPDGAWSREVIYAGPQGLRGVVTGRFTADPSDECLAVFGYSGRVQLLVRNGLGPWTVTDLFTDRDRGHWLAVAEVDGRNATDEIITSGYSGRVVLLSRPPGFGLGEVATDRTPTPALMSKVPRVAMKAGEVALGELSPLCYQGGFESKTAIYETLVRRDATGRIAPALASAWRFEDDGRRVVFTLRDGATFHDGSPVTARDVALHFRRWVGLPEHAWLRSSDHIVAVEARSTTEVCVSMDAPRFLLGDLCAINPGAIVAPSSRDREGAFVRPVGSGPFRFLDWSGDGEFLHLARADARGSPLDLVRLPEPTPRDALELLERGDVDVVASSWLVPVDPQHAARLRDDTRWNLVDGPGSAVRYLSFALAREPLDRPAVRARIRAAIDREALVRDVEAGLADPCTTWAAPSVTWWPRPPAAVEAAATHEAAIGRTLLLSAPANLAELGAAVVAQLARAGIVAELVPLAARTAPPDDIDLRLETTWGVPYDPYLSLVARFGPPLEHASAASHRARDVPSSLEAKVEELIATPDEQSPRGLALCAAIQAQLDAEVLVVPLYAPRRVTVARTGLPMPPVPDHDLYRTDLRFLTDTWR